MKKTLLTLIAGATIATASTTTINATMSLMEQGMNEIQKGFFYNQKDLILKGIETTDAANKIFSTVDVKEFTNGNRKTQVISNLHSKVTTDLAKMKKLVKSGKYADATAQYGRVVNSCVACHTIIRGW